MLERYAVLKAMKAVLAEPAKDFSVRGLAKTTRLSPGSAAACFAYMSERGIIKHKRIGRSLQFHANLENPLTREWKKVFELDQLQPILPKLIEQLDTGLISLVLYGSIAKGNSDPKSDYDLLAITTTKQEINISSITRKAGREINLITYTPAEWKRKSREDRVFYDQVIYNSIELFGERPIVV